MSEPQDPVADSVTGPSDGRRRWPWIAACVAGSAVGAVVWVGLGFALWFEAGGTLGGYGASASDAVDWHELRVLRARWEWIPVVIAFAVPTVWAWRWSRGEGAGTTAARRSLYGIVAIAAALAAWHPVALLLSDPS